MARVSVGEHAVTGPAERLLPHHRALLRDSAVSRDVWIGRGYRSIKTATTLRKAGFSEVQSSLVPGLLIPVWDIHGRNTRCQFRPDNPRPDHQSGRPHKYENLPGVGVALDVHPSVRTRVKDVSQALFITEGIRKGDAAATQGLAAVALYSVWNWRGTDESGALMVLPEWDEIPLSGRTVYIVFDSDVMMKRSVKLALERLARVLRARRATVKLVYLPGSPDDDKVGLDDWFAAGESVEDLLRLADDHIRGLPDVVANGRQLREVTQDAVAALEAANDPPQAYKRASTLVRIRVHENGRPFIEQYDAVTLKNRLTAVADFYRVNRDGSRSAVSPPDAVAKDILAMPDWTFPMLDAVVETPTVRPGGLVVDAPGYDAATQLVYVPEPELVMPRIPDVPSERWVRGARKLLLEVFQDFPFKDEASRANTLALVLTPIVRPAIAGPVPMALVDAPQAGTGKSLLTEVVAVIATGRNAEMMSPSRDEEEWRKQITSTLLKGPSLVVIDNLMGKVSSASLARALTAITWKDRILGRSEDAVLPQRATWVATGNNIILGGDLPRRTYLISQDAEMSRPWLRNADDFAHPQLLSWVRENRPRLLVALLALVRAWYVAGSPEPDAPVLGSYEEWCSIVGGVLAHAGIEGFLDNLEEAYDTLDPGEEQWEVFLRAWFAEFGSRPLLARDIHTVADSGQVLGDVLPDELLGEVDARDPGRFARKLGHALRFRLHRRYGPDGLYLDTLPDRKTKVNRWVVRRAGKH